MVHHFGPDWNISTPTGRIAMKFCTDIYGAQVMYPNVFGDPLTSSSANMRLSFWVQSEMLNQSLFKSMFSANYHISQLIRWTQ